MEEQLKIELIVESSLRYAVLCFYIPKKDRFLQLVQDYRKLNQHTIKNKMLLPLIKEVIDKLKNTKYFNKLDLIWRYNNVQIKEGNEWKVALLINKRLFDPKVMYLGLCNSLGIFQWLMNSVFQELLHKEVLWIILLYPQKPRRNWKKRQYNSWRQQKSITFASNDQNAISMLKKYLRYSSWKRRSINGKW